ncbi:hypothetical protein BCR35DRAFT_302581 [Leucosporidium creatinivorum]|uniref:VHS domain-containing protein n=1 Tax=Leucosporidium creatinivorum TaxID=106004 RepID=A0A1Y2FPS1_9BASI|nr:hypothetical protein BCR35DRAFT_302581 [Leucosporidium creatinivorum]
MKRLFGGKKSSSQPSPTADNEHSSFEPLPSSNPAQSPPPQAQYGGQQPQQQHGQAPPRPLQGYAVAHAPALGSARVMGPPRVTDVLNAIGWSCASPAFDYPYVLSLADYLATSSAAAKEAARALRKEFKHAVPDAQERAVRLTGILMRNTDLRFREQVASKKFLGELQDLATSKKTDPRVREMVLRVLSPLAFDYQRDAELSPITGLYNKLKPADWPVNGLPLDPSDPLLTPTVDPRNNLGTPRHRVREPRRLPTTSEQMKDLRREAEQARGNARLLSEAVAFASPDEELAANEIVQEFHAKCFASQEILTNNLQWATVQAEQSRAAADSQQPSRSSSGRSDSHPAPSPPPPQNPHPLSNAAMDEIREISPARNSPRLSSNNPFAPIVSGDQAMPPPAAIETEEEKTLSIILAAYSEVTEALAGYDSHQQNQSELLELQAVEERSKNETRFDRSKAGVPDEHGNYLSATSGLERGEGGSRPASRNASPARGGEDGLGEVISFHKPQPHDHTRPSPLAADPFADESASPSSPPRLNTDQDDRRQSRNPYAAYLSSPTTSPTKSVPNGHASAPIDDSSAYIIPDTFDAHRPLSASSITGGRMLYDEPEETHSEERHDNGMSSLPNFGGGSYNSGEGEGVMRRQGTDESFIATPSQPSEKALGKLRRLSLREGTESDPVDQQRKLEEALRAKYTQQFEEEGRRSGEFARRE